MTIKFEVLEQFIEQKEATSKAHGEMAEREAKAKEAYFAKVAEYEAMITKGAVEGKDMTAALDKLDEEIQKAKAAVARRAQEVQIYAAAQPLSKIKPEDVVTSFNTEIIPAFKRERFDAVLKQLLKTKSEYAKAVLDYKATVREFEGIRTEARSELSDHYYYKLQNADIQTVNEHDLYFITSGDIFDLNGGQPLRSLENVKTEELK